jgi:hypothetical protein
MTAFLWSFTEIENREKEIKTVSDSIAFTNKRKLDMSKDKTRYLNDDTFLHNRARVCLSVVIA